MERIALGIFFRSKKVVGSLMLSSFYDLPFPFSIKTSNRPGYFFCNIGEVS
jgi:hypothetical protein